MDLALLWIKQNLKKAENDLLQSEIAHCALNNKNTKFAQGIKRIMEAKRKVVQVWKEA